MSFAVGKDIGGSCIVGDIGKLPHVLIAGTTGSGKSVCTNSLIVSILYKSTPEEVRFIMVDPKMVELAPYNGIPHLLIPVVTDPKKAAGALQWAVFEMMKRYKLFSEHGVKDLAGYNALARQDEELKTMPTVVVVIDELADLMLVVAKEVEESICRVAQMAVPPDASGHRHPASLLRRHHRPDEGQYPSRIAFAVASSLGPASSWIPPAPKSWWARAICSMPRWGPESPPVCRAASSLRRRSSGWWASSRPPARRSTPVRSWTRSSRR
ncbi:MAG: FtsK/SpoIIIE domain-containing protein [Oscillospiraceae bacterium]